MKTRKSTTLARICTILTVLGLGLSGCNNESEPAHTHTWGEWVQTTASTCTARGMETRVCMLDASHTETRTIPINPNAHNWGAWVTTTPATETTDGVETRTCWYNSAHKDTRTIALNHIHQWGAWVETTPVTATTDGVETRTCILNPAHTETRTIPATSIITYTVNYNANGGMGDMENSTHEVGVPQNLRTNTFTHTGYIFAGWSTTAVGSLVYENSQSVTNLSITAGSVVTLYAQWARLPEMVQIPGGTFTMVRNDNDSWGVSHQVTLTGFYIGKYEVTQELYLAVMGINPSFFDGSNTTVNGYNKVTPSGEVQGNRPVEQVSWYNAVEFCNKLSNLEGLTPYYTINKTTTDPNNTNSDDTLKWLVTVNSSANGYRLPTEAQWEYACRAGTTTEWYFGDSDTNIGNYEWYDSNSGSKTHEVGKKSANAWGLYDMGGNVWEWCWDWWDWYDGSYSSDPQTDPTGAVSGDYRVVRGGYWNINGQYARSAYRSSYNPAAARYSNGFRLARP